MHNASAAGRTGRLNRALQRTIRGLVRLNGARINRKQSVRSDAPQPRGRPRHMPCEHPQQTSFGASCFLMRPPGLSVARPRRRRSGRADDRSRRREGGTCVRRAMRGGHRNRGQVDRFIRRGRSIDPLGGPMDKGRCWTVGARPRGWPPSSFDRFGSAMTARGMRMAYPRCLLTCSRHRIFLLGSEVDPNGSMHAAGLSTETHISRDRPIHMPNTGHWRLGRLLIEEGRARDPSDEGYLRDGGKCDRKGKLIVIGHAMYI